MTQRSLAVLLLALLASPAAADLVTGAVFVHGLPAGAETVHLQDGATPWSAAAPVADGEALFTGVPPGRYAVSWGPGPALSVRVDPGEVVMIDATAARVVGRGTLAWGTWFEAEALRSLPSSGDGWSLLETTEPVAVVDRLDTGGLFTGQPARVNAHGGSWTETSFLVDGLDVTDPRRGGRPLVLPSTVGASGLGFVSAAAPVDVAGSGPVFALLPAAGAARWSLSASAATRIGGASSDLSPPAVGRVEDWKDVDARVAGPLSSRGGLVLAGGWRRSAPDAFARPARVARGAAQATLRPAAAHQVHLSATAQDVARPGPVSGLGRVEDRRLGAAASWEVRRSSGAGAGARVGLASQRSEDFFFTGTVDRLLDGPVLEHVAERGGTARRATGDLWLRASPRRWKGWHTLSAGLQLSSSAARPDPLDATIVEIVRERPARFWTFESGTSRWSSREAALFVADRVLTGRLALEAGLRLDGAWADARGGGAIDGVTMCPRLSARWSVLGSEWLVFRGAWGRFAHRMPLEWVGHLDPAAPETQASLDPEWRRPRSDELLLALESRVGPLHLTFAGVDRRGRDLVETVNAGLLPGSYVPILVPDPAGDLLGPADDQLLPLYRRVPGVGTDRLVLTNPEGHSTKFQGVEFTAALRYPDRAGLLLGLTAHRSEGHAAYRGFRAFENDPALVGDLFDAPNADTFAYGRLFFDRAYTIKLSGWWRAPGDVRVGAVGRYQDGQPFARIVIDERAPQGADLVRAVPNGRHRYEYSLTVDARIEKGFTFGRARLGLVLEGFNLLDNRHGVEEDVVSGPFFRTPTLVQPPRVLRLGLRLDL